MYESLRKAKILEEIEKGQVSLEGESVDEAHPRRMIREKKEPLSEAEKARQALRVAARKRKHSKKESDIESF